MVDRLLALDAIAKNPWTALVVAASGELIDVVPFAAQPTPEAVLELARRGEQGAAFRLVQKAILTEPELTELVNSLAAAQDYSRTHDLRPGANMPGREDALARLGRRQSVLSRVARWCLDTLAAIASIFR
jgi:hypothetical protein